MNNLPPIGEMMLVIGGDYRTKNSKLWDTGIVVGHTSVKRYGKPVTAVLLQFANTFKPRTFMIDDVWVAKDYWREFYED